MRGFFAALRMTTKTNKSNDGDSGHRLRSGQNDEQKTNKREEQATAQANAGILPLRLRSGAE